VILQERGEEIPNFQDGSTLHPGRFHVRTWQLAILALALSYIQEVTGRACRLLSFHMTRMAWKTRHQHFVTAPGTCLPSRYSSMVYGIHIETHRQIFSSSTVQTFWR
jgi:hypothetical protein